MSSMGSGGSNAVIVSPPIGPLYRQRLARRPARMAFARSTTGRFFRGAFALLILLCSYDKSGVELSGTSVSYYKLFFFFILALYLLDRFSKRAMPREFWKTGPLPWIVGFIVIQTIASLMGALMWPEPWSAGSEVYYLIQRSMFLAIPLFAIKWDIPPRTVFKLFAGALSIHYAFVALQFLDPGAYSAFVEFVYDPLRTDNSLGWSVRTYDFFGLQHNGSYGAFVSAFGVLFIAFTSPRSRPKRMVAWGVVLFAMIVALTAASRSTFIMTSVAVLLYVWKTSQVAGGRLYVALATAAVVLATLLGNGTITWSTFGSLDAFTNEERAASAEGKLEILSLGTILVPMSPLVGFGQRRFTDLTAPLAATNDPRYKLESHSQVLSTMLSSGLIGVLAYLGAFIAIVRALWGRRERDAAIVCAMFVGMNVYNLTYDTGGLDFFACFNGLVAYYAVCAGRLDFTTGRPLTRAGVMLTGTGRLA